jgi:IstB-like ATP binding protein
MSAKTSAAANGSRNIGSEIAYLARALKAPTLAGAVDRLAERARSESWSHEEFLAACLQREVAAREAHGGEGRIRSARFPSRKSLEEFDFDHQRSLKRDVITHLGTLDFITAKENVVFWVPRAPVRPICRLVWVSAPAKLVTALPSLPPPNGSPAWLSLTTPESCRQN